MMADFIVTLAVMSLQASLIILVVLFVRSIFDLIHLPKKYSMLLWFVTFFFLIFPWKIASPVGFWKIAPANYYIKEMDSGFTVAKDAVKKEEGIYSDEERQKDDTETDSGIHTTQKAQEVILAKDGADGEKQENLLPEMKDKEKNFATTGDFLSFLSVVWGMGLLALLLYSGISYGQLKRKVLCSMRQSDNIYYADEITVPMVLGVFHPKIYIPSGIEKKYLVYVIAHERCHIHRKDFITKLLAYLIACIHWFNPFVWLAYHFMAKDMEMACDEETVSQIGFERKTEYARVLLQLSTAGRGKGFTLPLAFGEGDIKSRIKNLMRNKKTIKILTVIGVVLVCGMTVIFISKDEGSSFSKQEKKAKNSTGTIKRQPKIQNQMESEEEKELSFDTVREAFQAKKIGELNFLNYTNGEKNLLGEDSLNYNIDFYFQYKKEQYRLSVSYWKKTDELQEIGITRLSDSDYAWLYTTVVKKEKAGYPKERYPSGNDGLENFLRTKPKVEDWLDIKLPEGYTLGSYQGDLGYGGAALILPQVYVAEGKKEDSFAPAEWLYAGVVGRIPGAMDCFSFKNGKLQKEVFPQENHSSVEKVTRLDDLDWPAILLEHYNHDIYTGGQLAELMEQGIEPTETTSDYWHFFFVKEGEDVEYYLALTSKEFTREEAIAIARTVKIK